VLLQALLDLYHLLYLLFLNFGRFIEYLVDVVSLLLDLLQSHVFLSKLFRNHCLKHLFEFAQLLFAFIHVLVLRRVNA